MNGLNKVILIGTLGQDPTLSKTRDGKSYTTLRLATNRSWTNNDGKFERKTDWHRIQVFGKKGELCQAHLKKGASVAIEGYISTVAREEDGKMKWTTFINADDVNFMTSANTPSH